MQLLKSGSFFGITNKVTKFDGITVTVTEYTLPIVDWHYHENAYFTFLLAGKLIEGNRREAYQCSPGTLIFHNWQEPHYNIKPDGYTCGFHIEIQREWFDHFDVDTSHVHGSINIIKPSIASLFHTMHKETQLDYFTPAETIHALLLESFSLLSGNSTSRAKKPPSWVKRSMSILHDLEGDKITLATLACELNIHPVHLCRDFHHHFGYTFSEYVRKRRVEKSLFLLPQKHLSLTDIAIESGFFDQSHFIRCFKQMCGLRPLQYRKMLK